jgi:cation:H+ antiporter
MGVGAVAHRQTTHRYAPAGKGPIALQSKRSCKATLKNKKIREPKITRSVGARPFIFSVSVVVTLICGVILKGSGDVIAERIGLSSGLFGATVLAVSTSLPEMSTGLALTKPGN